MSESKPEPDRPLRGRRITWREFEALTGKKRPEAANDNDEKEQQWKS